MASADAVFEAVDAGVRAAAGDGVQRESRGAASTWRHGGRWATVVRHESPARYELTLHTGGEDHPQAEEIAPGDADLVDMLAGPIVAALRGDAEPH